MFPIRPGTFYIREGFTPCTVARHPATPPLSCICGLCPTRQTHRRPLCACYEPPRPVLYSLATRNGKLCRDSRDDDRGRPGCLVVPIAFCCGMSRPDPACAFNKVCFAAAWLMKLLVRCTLRTYTGRKSDTLSVRPHKVGEVCGSLEVFSYSSCKVGSQHRKAAWNSRFSCERYFCVTLLQSPLSAFRSARAIDRQSSTF